MYYHPHCHHHCGHYHVQFCYACSVHYCVDCGMEWLGWFPSNPRPLTPWNPRYPRWLQQSRSMHVH